MSRWNAKLGKHAIHDTIRHLKIILEKLDLETFELGAPDDEASIRALSERQRVMNLLSAIEKSLKNVDSELVPLSLVERVDSFLKNSTKMYLEKYSTTRNLRALITMNDELSDVGLSDIAQLVSLAKGVSTTAQSKELEEAFSSATEQIETTITELEEMTDSYSQAKENLEANKKEYDERTREMLEDAESTREQILNLHGIIAGESEAAGYLKNANVERKRAMWWQIGLFALIGAAVVWVGGLSAFVISQTTFNTESNGAQLPWQSIYRSMSVTLLIVFGAGFAARQSGKHRDAETYNRNKALDILAFNPFIANLDIDEQKKLRALATRMFFKLDNGSTNISSEGRMKSDNEQEGRSELDELLYKRSREQNSNTQQD